MDRLIEVAQIKREKERMRGRVSRLGSGGNSSSVGWRTGVGAQLKKSQCEWTMKSWRYKLRVRFERYGSADKCCHAQDKASEVVWWR